MPKFKVGDEVECVVHHSYKIKKGQTGTITEVVNGGVADVKWDNFEGKGHTGRDGSDFSRSTWAVYTKSLQVIQLSLENE